MTISVLLPSRGRPASLCRAVSSLAFGDVEIIVGLDSDDPTAGEAWRGIAHLPFVKVITTGRHETTAQLFNFLQGKATGDWFVPFPDDYTVDDPNWAEVLHSTVASLPASLGVAYLHDPMYPYFATFPCVSRKLVEMQGFFLPPFFPFLYGDTWMNEIGVLSGLILRCDASVSIQRETGGIHNFRNMRLWANMFHKTRPLRTELAVKMIQAAFGDTEQASYMISTIGERSLLCEELQGPQMTEAFFQKWDNVGDGFPHPAYLALEAKAQAFMELQ